MVVEAVEWLHAGLSESERPAPAWTCPWCEAKKYEDGRPRCSRCPRLGACAEGGRQSAAV